MVVAWIVEFAETVSVSPNLRILNSNVFPSGQSTHAGTAENWGLRTDNYKALKLFQWQWVQYSLYC